MGKALIFTNADFSAVAVGSNYVDMPLSQGGVYLVPGSPSTGKQSDSSTSNYLKRINFTNAFYWENGHKMRIRGLKGLTGAKGSLKIDGGIYSSQNWGHESVVNTMNGLTTHYYPINVDGTEDEIELTNTWGSYWFVLSFSPQNGTDETLVADFSPMQIRVY